MSFTRSFEAYAYWDSDDYAQFIRPFQTATHNKPLEHRGPLVVPPVLTKYLTSDRHGRNVALIAASRSKATQQVYNRTLLKVEEFLANRLETLMDVDEDNIADYIYELDLSKEKYSYVKTLKGSICFLLVALQLPDCWSSSLQKIYEGIYTRSSCERRLTQKAPYLPLQAYQDALSTHITSKLHEPQTIPFIVHRTAVIQTLQFALLARISDVQKLRSCDFMDVELNGTPALAVTFRTAKNDPRFMGATSYLVKAGGPFCSYSVVKSYLDTYGFKLASSDITDTSYIICRSRGIGKGKRWDQEGNPGDRPPGWNERSRRIFTCDRTADTKWIVGYGVTTSPKVYSQQTSFCDSEMSSTHKVVTNFSKRNSLPEDIAKWFYRFTICKTLFIGTKKSCVSQKVTYQTENGRFQYTNRFENGADWPRRPVPFPDPKPGPPAPEPAPSPPPTPYPLPDAPPAA